jgi:hypothetical protein
MMMVTALEVVRNVTFIHLKVRTRSTKTTKEETKQWQNDALSRLNPKIRVFNLEFGKL